jgi:hypothetical protein
MHRAFDTSLVEAIRAYQYPAVTYDFAAGRECAFGSMIDLEQFLNTLLFSVDPRHLKDGLSGIIFWGFYRVGFRDRRVNVFRSEVSDAQLLRAREVFSALEGTGLVSLKRIELPQFSNMAFLTKLRMFLDPEHFCVLDRKIASLSPLAVQLKRQKTSIPVNAHNELVYKWWIDRCSSLASRLPHGTRPVDVERGLFQLIDSGRLAHAEELLNNLAP